MFVHCELELLRQSDLFLGEKVGFGEALADLCAQQVLFRIELVTAVGLYPFLYLSIAILDHANTVVV